MKSKRRLLLFMTCLLILMIPVVSLGAVKTIPDSSVIVAADTRLKMGYGNHKAVWNGVSGKVVTSGYSVPCLMIPIKSTTSSWSYTDFLDITFSKAGTIAGRSIDVKIHFNSVKVDPAYNSNNIREDKYMCVMPLWPDAVYISDAVSTGMGYQAAAVYDMTVTIVWSDTGALVDLPFFMSVSDLDSGNAYYKEGWEGLSGFSGTYYIYKENILNISGNQFISSDTEATGGKTAYTKTGLYAPTKSGTFRMKYYEGSCATLFELYSQYDLLENPVKAIK